MTYFQNKKIWITGASSGIGKALAIEAAQRGASLILSSRSPDALRKVKDLCPTAPSVDIITLDLEDHGGLQRIFDENRQLVSEVDILVNNAGISQRSQVRDTKFEVYRRLMEINYLGTIALSLKMNDVFLRRGSGHFVTISSMAGKFGVPLRSGYSAAKMALHGFFESMRAEQSDVQIFITMVCPGFIHTDVSKNALTGDGDSHGVLDKAQEQGMTPQNLAKKLLKAIEDRKEEVLIGGFKETKLANFVNRIFPSVFRKIIAKSEVT